MPDLPHFFSYAKEFRLEGQKFWGTLEDPNFVSINNRNNIQNHKYFNIESKKSHDPLATSYISMQTFKFLAVSYKLMTS